MAVQINSPALGLPAGLNPDQLTAVAAYGSALPTLTASWRIGAKVEVAYGTYTFHLTCRAPAHYDGVRIIAHHAVNSSNAYKATCAAPAAVGGTPGRNPLDASGSAMPMIPITWGTTDPSDTRNPGGGATTFTFGNASGSGATLQEGYAVSDYIPLSSLPQTAGAGLPPLFVYRVTGTDPGAANIDQASYTDANPFSAAEPDFVSGYWGGDQTAVSAPAAALNQGWLPAVTIIFYLRGTRCLSIGASDDSIGQGWVPAGTTPVTAGLIDGWPRRLVRSLNAVGMPASLTMLGQSGEQSKPWHERAYSALLAGGLSNLFIKPWSINENGVGPTSVPPALARTTRLIDLARRKGVVPIITRPWGGQDPTGASGALVQSYCDNAASTGVIVFDARSVVGATTLNSAYVCRDAGGTALDGLHVNVAGHAAIAAYAMTQRDALRLT